MIDRCHPTNQRWLDGSPMASVSMTEVPVNGGEDNLAPVVFPLNWDIGPQRESRAKIPGGDLQESRLRELMSPILMPRTVAAATRDSQSRPD